VNEYGTGTVSKGEGIGTQTTYNFTTESKKRWENSNGVEYSEFGDVVHEMQHQYDYDTGNMADAHEKSSAKDPSEKRAVATENIAREMEGKDPRTKYGGEIIEYDSPDSRKEKNNN
jgi:hypothetical protein